MPGRGSHAPALAEDPGAPDRRLARALIGREVLGSTCVKLYDAAVGDRPAVGR